MKNDRHNAILRIIVSMDVETQNQLREELATLGFECTQATLSRDIKDLQLIKELTAYGKHRYVTSSRSDTASHSAKLKTILKESVNSYTHAGNLVVVKTIPGLAPAVCSAFDSMAIDTLAGSIAGDDTGFLAMADTESARQFCLEIGKIIG